MKTLYNRLNNGFTKPANKPLTKDRIQDSLMCCVPVAIYAVIYLVWFNYLERTNLVHYTEIHTKLDDKIPFLEIFIIPYFLWFFYVAFAIFYPLIKYDLEDFFKAITFLCIGMTLFLICSTLFPNIQYLRPAVMPRDNIFSRMVAILYSTDTPTNLWPSMHVYNAIGAYLCISNSERFSPLFKKASLILSLAIIASTMFIKQHSVLDVLSAFALSFVVYILIYRTELVVNYSKWHAARREAKLTE